MRRVSKREVQFRFDLIDEVRVAVTDLGPRSANVQVAGVSCHLSLLRSEWQDITRPGVLRAWVADYPVRNGDGSLPKGTRPDGNEFPGLINRSRQVSLGTDGVEAGARSLLYEKFLRDHPLGSIVEARVVERYSNKLRIMFPCGLSTRMATTDYVDRWPKCTRMEVGNLNFPDHIEVIVRRVDIENRVIAVTMHGFPRDQKYCDAASGYRSHYDAVAADFSVLPWNRTRES
jgi:hypothetical protein